MHSLLVIFFYQFFIDAENTVVSAGQTDTELPGILVFKNAHH